jgi:retinol dehydrogenase-12
MTWFTNFLYSQLLVTLPYPTKDFTGQTIISTGANTGLEFEAAKHFIRLHASEVILAVRSLEKAVSQKNPFSLSTHVLLR